jgi:hypothetical protein
MVGPGQLPFQINLHFFIKYYIMNRFQLNPENLFYALTHPHFIVWEYQSLGAIIIFI